MSLALTVLSAVVVVVAVVAFLGRLVDGSAE
jgi:hypothetical protein